MTALTSVLQILQEAGNPLHYREITKRILAKLIELGETLHNDAKEVSA